MVILFVVPRKKHHISRGEEEQFPARYKRKDARARTNPTESLDSCQKHQFLINYSYQILKRFRSAGDIPHVEAGKCGAVETSGKPGATESYRASGGARRRLEKPKSGAPPPASTAETHMMAALEDFTTVGRSKRAFSISGNSQSA